jgi:hypothetical protein
MNHKINISTVLSPGLATTDGKEKKGFKSHQILVAFEAIWIKLVDFCTKKSARNVKING